MIKKKNAGGLSRASASVAVFLTAALMIFAPAGSSGDTAEHGRDMEAYALTEEKDAKTETEEISASYSSVRDHDIGSGSITCKDTGVLYRITGSTDRNHITVKGGTSSDPVLVDLNGVSIDLHRDGYSDSIDASPLTVTEGSYAVIYAGKDSSSAYNYLYGGNSTGIGKDWGYAGLCMEEDSHVTIAGNGTLKAHGGGEQYGGAGIGSNYDDDLTDLKIQGSVKIDAEGAHSAAGIGSGRDGEVIRLEILSGNITAQGGRYAAGIGGGDAVGTGDGGTSHSIMIKGGTIKARGGEYGAGIGGSEGGECERIEITGGSIEASGGNEGAGIGGGDNADIDDISISGADIKANGGKYGAGIGSADNRSGNISINLKNNTIEANGGKYGAGIGGGYDHSGTISIKGSGSIRVHGREAAGIGAGRNSEAEDIHIQGTAGSRDLIIDARAEDDENRNYAAAIGSGTAGSGDITLENAEITAWADYNGAGIGSGNSASLTKEYIDTIRVSNCGIRIRGGQYGAGIGAGSGGSVNNIIISDSTYEGPSIGSSSANDNIKLPNDIELIKISGSRINASANTTVNKCWAAVGTGPRGNIENLQISYSDITAKGANGGAGIGSGGCMSSSSLLTYSGGKARNIDILRSRVNAEASDGAAAIGGGVYGTAENIRISDCTEVTAVSRRGTMYDGSGGAGIGGGYGASADNIHITSSKVDAQAYRYGAGIGSGGTDSMLTTFNDTHTGLITIDGGSDVTAKGSTGGAGIGTGMGGQTDKGITITDSTVDASGGEGGAGIGAGSDAAGGRGGEAYNIKITGRSKVKAAGGEGGAGIGGGFSGGADRIVLDLETDAGRTYYVDALGGGGAAGIGSGGVYDPDSIHTSSGYKVIDILIAGGYIKAQGGGNSGGCGGGAGIGGGARRGYVHGLDITGGYIEAHGRGTGAKDIGHGSDGGVGTLTKDKDISISGGTVASGMTDDCRITVTGGSISADIQDAADGNGKPVYRTALTLADEANTLMKNVRCSRQGYGVNDIFSDDYKKIYFYLLLSGSMDSTADVDPGNGSRHYYGTTLEDNTGVMKMGGKIAFIEPDKEILKGAEFTLRLDDSSVEPGTEFGFTAEGSAHIEKVTKGTAPQAALDMMADDFGDFTVKASGRNEDDPVYWDAQGEYHGKVKRAEGKIEITGYPGKIYDSRAAEDPEIKKNGDGEVSFAYYRGDTAEGQKLPGPPSDAGTYTVTAEMAETALYTGAVSEPVVFVIARQETVLSLSAEENGDKAGTVCEAAGLYEANGKIRFAVSPAGSGSIEIISDIVKDGDSYCASADFDMVPGDTYTVTASYIPGSPENYYCSTDVEREFSKSLASRKINVSDPAPKTYGDSDISLGAEAENGRSTAGDIWSYEIVNDVPGTAIADISKPEAAGSRATVSVDGTGRIRILNAGRAVIRITLEDGSARPVYEDAEAFVTVKVKKAPLHVRSLIKNKNAEGAARPGMSAVYGSLDDLSYEIGFDKNDLRNGDTKETFTKGLGTLEAVPVTETAGVSAVPYDVGIAKNGTDIIYNGREYRNVFISRNYEIIPENGKLTVTPAELSITAEDSEGAWGKEPEYTYSISGAVPWDDISSIFSSAPEAYLDEKAAGGPYASLKPGTYEDSIDVRNDELRLNSSGMKNYTASKQKGTLYITKAKPVIDIEAESKTFDGKPAEVKITAGGDAEYTGVIVTEYCRCVNAENGNELIPAGNEPPSDAGRYLVKAMINEDDCFFSAENEAWFDIRKAVPDPVIPEPDDMVIEDGLKLSAQPLPHGWEWVNPDRELSVGFIYARAVYTPDDNDNYRKIIREISFGVAPSVEAKAQPGVTGAVIDAHTQSGADVYCLIFRDDLPDAEKIKNDGKKVHAPDGTAYIELTGLSPETSYRCAVISELNGCTSSIEEIAFTTGKNPPAGPGDGNGGNDSSGGGAATGDSNDIFLIIALMTAALTGITAVSGYRSHKTR